MVRFLLFLLLLLLLGRALYRLLYGVIEGASGVRSSGGPERGVPMARDPVCGTFVVRSRALTLGDGIHMQYFCSEECRRRYRLSAPKTQARS